MYNTVVRGSTSNIIRVKLRSSASPFNGKTAMAFNSTGLSISTIANNEATDTKYTTTGSTIETITTLGTFATPTATKCRFKEVDATDHPGLYEIQLDDARYAVSSAKSLFITIKGVSGLLECDVVITLVDVNPYDPVRFGMTALPYVAAGSNGGLPTGTASSGLSTQAKADVNAEVLDVLSTDTFGEPTGVPGATLTLREKIGWLFMALRNKVGVNATKKQFYDDGGAVEWEKDLTDDGTDYTESEGNAP